MPHIRTALPGLFTASLLLSGQSASAGVSLSEVMGDPTCSEYYTEFIELFCTGPDSVDLAGWSIALEGDDDALQFEHGGSRLGPGRRALILDAGYAGNSDCYEELIPDSVLRLTIADAAFGQNGIPNSRTVRLQLLDGAGNSIDEILYPGPGPPGHSWERMTFTPVDTLAGDWSLPEHGTPGCRNSVEPDSFQLGWQLRSAIPRLRLFNNGLLPLEQLTADLSAFYAQTEAARVTFELDRLCPGDTVALEPGLELQAGWVNLCLALHSGAWRDTLTADWYWSGISRLRFNEIMPDPGQRGPEWLELINAHSGLPLNLRGYLLADNCGEEQRPVVTCDWILQPDELIVLTGDGDAFAAEWGDLPCLEPGGMPLLANTADCLDLFAPDSTLLETLGWDAEWRIESGYSMERYNPSLANDVDGWSRSLAAAGATPAAPNSIRIDSLPAAPAHRLSSDLLTPDGDGRDEVLVITLAEAGYHVQLRVRVFTLSGVCVRELESGDYGAAFTRVLWDGRDDAGRLLSPGAYVLLTETAVAGGSTSHRERHAVALYY